MFGKLKAKAEEKKAQMQKEKETKWIDEVTADKDAGSFKDFQGWKDVYEPKKEKGDKEDSGPSAVEKKIYEKMANNIKENVVKMLMEVTSQLLGPTEAALRADEPDLANFINAGNGVALTYRFKYKNDKKFAFIRKHGAGRIATTLVDAINAAAKKDGIENIDEAAVEKIVADLTAKVTSEIEAKQKEAEESLANSPMFAAAQDAAGDENAAQMDEGVKKLMAFLQGYVQEKTGVVVSVLNDVVGKLLKTAAKHKAAIDAHIANAADAAKENAPEGDEAFQKAQEDVLKDIEEGYKVLDDNVGAYATSLVGLVTGASEE